MSKYIKVRGRLYVAADAETYEDTLRFYREKFSRVVVETKADLEKAKRIESLLDEAAKLASKGEEQKAKRLANGAAKLNKNRNGFAFEILHI